MRRFSLILGLAISSVAAIPSAAFAGIDARSSRFEAQVRAHYAALGRKVELVTARADGYGAGANEVVGYVRVANQPEIREVAVRADRVREIRRHSN